MIKDIGFGKGLPALISWGPENIPPHTRDHVRTTKIMAFFDSKEECHLLVKKTVL